MESNRFMKESGPVMMRRSTALVALGLIGLAPGATTAQQNFGSSAAVVGDQVVIGQPANFYGPGAVYFFSRNAEGSWVESGRLFSPDSVLADGFGRGLAAASDRLLVGAPMPGGAGTAYLFGAPAASGGEWDLLASLPPVEGGGSAAFGSAVALTGDLGVVGAPDAREGGAVYLFDLGGDATVVLEPQGMDGSRFGSALSVEGDVLIVGAPGAESQAGRAVVYRRADDGSWAQEAVLEPGGDAAGFFGASVALRDGRAFVGAPRGNRGAGATVVFRQSGDGWTREGLLSPDEGSPGSGFGTAIGLVAGEVWVGAPGGGGGDGIVHRFAAEEDGSWTGAGSLLADSANTAAWPFAFGSAIGAGDELAVVGMPRRDFGEGRAAILTPAGAGAWDETATVFGDIATAVTAIEEGADCDTGSVEIFECNNIEVVSFTPVSQLGGARGVWVNDVWGWTDPETGKDYALVSRRDGAAFVDLSDPGAPRLVGSLPRTSGSRPSVWRDIKVYGNHAFVVSDGAGAHGMQVFDLTRLRSVQGDAVTFDADAHYDRIFSAHNLVADTASGFLYIAGANGGGETCGGGLHMVDARNPKSPVFAGCYSDPTGPNSRGYSHDAQCVVYSGPDERYTGRQICVGSNEGEINVADVTDKDSPVPLGRASYPNVAYAHQGWFDESQRYFYMGDEGDEVSGLVEGTRTLVWDLSELDDPILVREYIAPVEATDHNLFVRGDRVYQSNYGSGLRVLDISDPENPYEVAFFDSAPRGNNEAGMSSAQSGAWSNYPFFESGLVVFTSVREGLFVVRVKPRELIP